MLDQDSTQEALLVLDAELNVRAANKGFYTMFRLAPGECIGRKIYEVGDKPWDAKLRPLLEAVLRGESQSDHFEIIREEKEGDHGVLWLSARLVPSPDASDATVLLTIEDISTRRPVEETLARRTQELNTLADFAGRAAHELNNMLTVIRMNADLIEGTLVSAGLPASEAVDIRLAADRAEALTKNLLVNSRRAFPQLTGLDRGIATVPLPGSPLRESGDEIKARQSSEKKKRHVRGLKHGAPTGRETILLVDDEKSLRKLGKQALSAAGYHVLEASDGAMALRIVAEEVGEIDLVLTDVEMPTLGGRGMVDELHELSPGMRVLFMSGYTDNEILGRGIRTSESEFLKKPFTADTLCAAVRAVLSKPSTAQA